MYKWVFDSLLASTDAVNPRLNLLLAVHNDDIGRSILYDVCKDYASRCDVHHAYVDYYTRGPVETCKLCIDKLEGNPSFWVLDNDILYDKSIDWTVDMQEDELCIVIQDMTIDDKKTYDMYGYSPYSHVMTSDGYVTDIVEKVYTSDHIVLGAYGFGSRDVYDKIFKTFVNDTTLVSKEWFMSSLVKSALSMDIKVKAVHSNTSVAIGTPEQVEHAVVTGAIRPKKLRWVFDLDNTIVTYPRVPGDYTTVQPKDNIIRFIRLLYESGHYIIIHTARHMKTCNDDVDMVKATVSEITKTTLNAMSVPYHELVFGKPYGDVYVDDKCTNPTHWCPEWIVSSIGFGWTSTICPQMVHNKIIKLDHELCYKLATCDEADGYRTFLKQCPEELLEHIPKLYGVTYDSILNKWKLLMEWKQDTIPVGKLYIHKMLTDDVFDHVLQLLKLLHSVPLPPDSDKLALSDACKLNYVPKLKDRLDHHSIYGRIGRVNVRELELFFAEYQPSLAGCIHGDFWFSNLLWSHNETKLYMIDMRGRIGTQPTIVGDIMYDYAKLYQSINGFDTLIHNGTLPDQRTKAHLEERFIQFFNITPETLSKIRRITAMLMLGSLPFHHQLESYIDTLRVVIEDLWPNIFISNK